MCRQHPQNARREHPATESMLKLTNITKTYSDGTQALNTVDLSFGRGLLGLLGPNGAGKTTLLSILTLAQEPSTGERLYFDLDDRPRHRQKIRRMIGYLPQEFLPLGNVTGFEYLEICATWRQVPLSRRALKRRIWALLEAVELTDAAHREAARYSGGMIRRLGLAQAILHSPKFLVVDEPTAGLDPEERIRFRNLITDLADEIPVLLSTHIVEDIEATCPRLAILARGSLLFDGAPSELMHRAEGYLWQLPAGTEPKPEMITVARRVSTTGESVPVIYSETPLPAATEVSPNLEEACSLFLVLEASQSLSDEPEAEEEHAT